MGYIVDVSSETRTFWSGRTGNTSKQQKIVAFSENFLNEDNFKDILDTFCYYDYGVNASETV